MHNSFIINKSYFVCPLLYDVMSSNKQRLTTEERLLRQRIRAGMPRLVRLGVLEPGPCEFCGESPAEWHHIDYSQPQRVARLCTKHHHQTHSQFAKPAPNDWMADIRAAIKQIESARLASRANRLDFLRCVPKSVELPRDKAGALR